VTNATRRTAFLTDERFFLLRSTVVLGDWVEGGLGFESPEPRRRLLHLLRSSGLLEQLLDVPPRPADDDALALVHDLRYLARIRVMSDADGGEAGEYASFGPGTYEIAALAAGAAADAISVTLDGRADNAYALVRPPGHHAERDRGRGYCIFANIAVAIRMAQRDGRVSRVAVVDVDVHHGNGTEQAFLTDPSVLTISIHQDRSYPEDSGDAGQTGEGHGEGANVNIPLPPGAGVGAYMAAMQRLVLPALEAFEPEVIVLAAGFDAGGLDPLGRMLLPASAFGDITRLLVAAAESHGHGRVVAIQEGGYSALHVPFCGLRVVEALSGAATEVVDPFAWLETMPGQELTNDQRVALDAIEGELRQGGVRLASP
jgi:acetoin utilization deacetylase AcuC-like enzyme